MKVKPKSNDEVVTTLTVRRSLHRKFKEHAKKNGRSLWEATEEALKGYMKAAAA